jgi:UDP-2-acetamido-3-amino-2,3-dideoxy-glucuronate N-acetyltransferase
MAAPFVHESAYVDDGAVIGDGTKIWHFCHVMPGAVIGEGCSLGQNVVVMPGTRIGNNVKIQNNVSIYEGVELEDDVFCGPSMVFTNVINPRSHISRKSEYRRTLVRRGVSIGANATVVCGVELGAYAFVGAGAVVTSNEAVAPSWSASPLGRSGGCASAGNGSRRPAAVGDRRRIRSTSSARPVARRTRSKATPCSPRVCDERAADPNRAGRLRTHQPQPPRRLRADRGARAGRGLRRR